MADMREFGKMDIEERGGPHTFAYPDQASIKPDIGPTPGQTIGPFFAFSLMPKSYGYPFKDIHPPHIVPAEFPTGYIVIEGQIFDGQNAPIHDAMIEIIQADESGNYANRPRDDGFVSYARCASLYARCAPLGPGAIAEKGNSHFCFRTVKPGRTRNGHAPSINILVTMRGLRTHRITRIYFPDDDHSSDPVMQKVPQSRRSTLIAAQRSENRFRFDIRMQGESETVFFQF